MLALPDLSDNNTNENHYYLNGTRKSDKESILTRPVTSKASSAPTDTILIDINAHNIAPELLVSAVLQRISQYNTRSLGTGDCAQSAATIEYHLRTLADLPTLAPVLRATCQQLSEQWALVGERAMPKHPRSASTFLTRLISGGRTN